MNPALLKIILGVALALAGVAILRDARRPKIEAAPIAPPAPAAPKADDPALDRPALQPEPAAS